MDIIQSLLEKVSDVKKMRKAFFKNLAFLINSISRENNIIIGGDLSKNIMVSSYALNMAFTAKLESISSSSRPLTPGKIASAVIINLFFSNIIHLKKHLINFENFLDINYYSAIAMGVNYIVEIDNNFPEIIKVIKENVLDGSFNEKSLGIYLDEIIKIESNNEIIRDFYRRKQ